MQQMMAQMMSWLKPGENHKLLAVWSAPELHRQMWRPPIRTRSRKYQRHRHAQSPLDGHYFVFEVNGKMQMPGADGKMKDMDFKGMSIEAYNNVTKKFEAAWMDNMGTGIFISQGDYDPATKTFTYTGEMEMVPGTKTKVREVVKVVR